MNKTIKISLIATALLLLLLSLSEGVSLLFTMVLFLIIIIPLFVIMRLSIFLANVIYWERGKNIKRIAKLIFLLMCIFLLFVIFYSILYMRPAPPLHS